MNTDDGKRENKLLLLFFSAILKILPGIKSLINEDGNVNKNVAENSGLNYRIQSLHVGMQPPGSLVNGEQKKCWHKLGKKFDWFQTERIVYQHHAA